jgi:hypothetical protein
LRHRYLETAADYYTECARRLQTIKRYIASASNDFDLQSWRSQLSALSTLITHIERSHLEEFSWPFADALERVSKRVCARVGTSEAPLFFFMAQGKFADYAVRYDETTAHVRRRDIYSVFFPRTLKDQVLLHAIFGHEIGHAALEAQPRTYDALSVLRDNSILTDIDSFFSWCQVNLHVQHRVSDEYLKSQAACWAKEIFCDLFGLIMIGPAFIPAFTTLIEPSYRPSGFEYVPSHPPYSTRALALLQAARALHMLPSEEGDGKIAQLTKELDNNFKANATRYEQTPYAFLDKSNIERASVALADFMDTFADELSPLRCPTTDERMLDGLVAVLLQRIPPVSPLPHPTRDGLSPPELIDFRHLLYAGWIGWSKMTDASPEEFAKLNRYCAHAILQQEGVRCWNRAEAVGAQ